MAKTAGHLTKGLSDRSLWLMRLNAGLLACFGAGASILLYGLDTWDNGSHRPWLVAVAMLVIVQVPILWGARQRIIDGRYRLTFFIAWNAVSYFMVMLACSLDGGISSPVAL